MNPHSNTEAIRVAHRGRGRPRSARGGCWLTRPTPHRPTGPGCAPTTSVPRSQSRPTRPPTVGPEAHAADAHRPSTPSPTRTATPWNAASATSSTTGPWLPGTTSSPCATGQPPISPASHGRLGPAMASGAPNRRALRARLLEDQCPADLVRRHFEAFAPCGLWVADIPPLRGRYPLLRAHHERPGARGLRPPTSTPGGSSAGRPPTGQCAPTWPPAP